MTLATVLIGHQLRPCSRSFLPKPVSSDACEVMVPATMPPAPSFPSKAFRSSVFPSPEPPTNSSHGARSLRELQVSDAGSIQRVQRVRLERLAEMLLELFVQRRKSFGVLARDEHRWRD